MTESRLPDRFMIGGQAFDLPGLLHHCRQETEHAERPEWQREVFAFIRDFLDTDRPGLYQYSSGSTGEPKRSMLSRPAMLTSASRTLAYFDLQAGDRILLCLPMRYIAGKMMVVRALLGELDLCLTEPSGRPIAGGETSFDFAAMVPLQVHNLLGAREVLQGIEGLSRSDVLQRTKCLLIGGGEIHRGMRSRLAKLEGPLVYESFAMTETYSHFALRRVRGPDAADHFQALEGVRLDLDQRGCLVVDVSGVTDGPLVTNDLVRLSEDRRGFVWLGRIDNVIKSGGIKIIPEQLESRITAALGSDCLLLPEKDERLGQRMVLMLEYTGPAGHAGSADHASTTDPDLSARHEAWLAALRHLLQPHECPARIVTIPRIPRNASMKPDRRRAAEYLSK